MSRAKFVRERLLPPLTCYLIVVKKRKTTRLGGQALRVLSSCPESLVNGNLPFFALVQFSSFIRSNISATFNCSVRVYSGEVAYLRIFFPFTLIPLSFCNACRLATLHAGTPRPTDNSNVSSLTRVRSPHTCRVVVGYLVKRIA